MKKRVISGLLAAILSVSLLAGCSGSSSPSSLSAASGPDTASSGDASSFSGYPMDAQDKEITFWVGFNFTLNEAYASAEESPFHIGLEEQTGIPINWQFPTTGTDSGQAFNLMLASDTLPDIIYYSLMTDAERYMEENVIRDLSDHIQAYSPAYYSWLQSNSAYDKAMKTDNGKYYGYGFFREDGGWNDTYLGPVVRQDWLDALNLESPKTVSDWDTVIRAFKQEYSAPLSFAWSRFNTTGISGAFGAYGATAFKLYVDDNGKIQLAQAQPEWKDYMAQLHQWWADGLIDQDVTSLDDTAARAKALNGGMGISVTSMGQLTNWEQDAKDSGNGAEWVGVQYPTGDDGTLSMVFGGYGVGTAVSVITSSCPDEKLETAMRLLDYAYTDEGNLYWNFGTKGVSWDDDASGEPEFTPLVTEDPDGLNNAISKYSGSVWGGSCIQATKLLYLKNSETGIKANDTWFYENQEVTAKSVYPPGVTLTTEESNQLDELVSSLSTYVSETAVKYITGEESLDNFDQFVATLNEMGLPKVLEIRQAAYDRYLAR